MRRQVIVKESNIRIHQNIKNRRVKYDEKDFDVLVVHITDNDVTRSFAISSDFLPETDSIHFSWIGRQPVWSPKQIAEKVVEVTRLFL